MDYPTLLPYFDQDVTLPGPLLTEAGIRSSNEVISAVGGQHVVGMGAHYVVKYGVQLDVIEVQSMIFVRRKTRIPVPHVYAIFASADRKTLFFVLQRIRGVTLASVWPDMSKAQKDTVMKKLGAFMDELRHLPSPGYYGSNGRRQLLDSIFWSGGGTLRNPAVNGPFATEAQFNEGLVAKSIQISSEMGLPPCRGEFYRRSLPTVLHGHRPVFTHGDFQRKNVMVRRVAGRDSSPVDDYEFTIIDWATAGWYPTYWEYCSASWSFRWTDDWPQKIESVIRPYRSEYPWLHMIFNDLWS